MARAPAAPQLAGDMVVDLIRQGGFADVFDGVARGDDDQSPETEPTCLVSAP